MAWYSTRNRVILLLAVGIVLIGLRVYGLYVAPWLQDRELAMQAAHVRRDATVVKSVDVTEPYALRWAARDGVPALHLVLPVADFGNWRRAEHAKIVESDDGPAGVQLELALPGSDGLTMAAIGEHCMAEHIGKYGGKLPCPSDLGNLILHRTPGGRVTADLLRYLRDGSRNALERLRESRTYPYVIALPVWIREGPGGSAETAVWHFAGWDCSEDGLAESSDRIAALVGDLRADQNRCHVFGSQLERWFPGYFNLHPVRALGVCQDGTREHCAVYLLYRGRLVEMRTRVGPGAGLLAGLAKLERIASDSTAPPLPEELLKRAERVYEDCRLASGRAHEHRALGRVGEQYRTIAARQCGLAAQMARTLLVAVPIPAARIVTSVIAEHEHSPRQWDRWYAEEALAALALAGAAEGHEAVLAHLIRARPDTGTPEDVRRASYDALRQYGPRVAAAEPKLLVSIDRALLGAARSESEPTAIHPATAFLRDTLEYAERASGGQDADIVFHMRFLYCARLLETGGAPKALGDCADALLAAWRRRNGGALPHDQSIQPQTIGQGIARMLRGCAEGGACPRSTIDVRLGEVREILAPVRSDSADRDVTQESGK